MRPLRAWVLRLNGLFDGARRERELADELESHLQLHIEDNLRSGMTPVEARRQALIKLGGIEQTKEICRDRSGFPLVESLFQDLRYGLRTLRKNPGFTTMIVLTLAVGIGANAAMFSVVNSILLRPLPYNDPDRLVTMFSENSRLNVREQNISYPNFLDYRRESHSFEHMAVASFAAVILTGEDQPEKVLGMLAATDYFSMLGVRPMLGRAFLPEEEQPGRDEVVVLGYRLWQRRFGADPNVIGKILWSKGKRRTIIGVMPSSVKDGLALFTHDDIGVFLPPSPPSRPQVEMERFGAGPFSVVARLKPGVTISEARAEMGTIASRLEQLYPINSGYGVTVVPLREQMGKKVRRSLWLLMGAVGFLLLIACTNVAGSLIARGESRRKEMAMRAGLGASRGRLIGQLLTESVLLGLLGGAVGLAIAALSVNALVALSPADVPRLDQVKIDGRVLSFTMAACLGTGLLFGLLPAWRVSKPDLNECLKEGGRTFTGGLRSTRVRSVLVVSEIALSFMLVIGAGLMIRSIIALQRFRWGFDPDHLVAMRLRLSGVPGNMRTFCQRVIPRLTSIPGVKYAGGIDSFISPGVRGEGYRFRIRAQSSDAPSVRRDEISIHSTTPNYFRTVGIPLLAGRAITEQDTATAPRAIVINQTMARRFWPAESPLGRQFQLLGDHGEEIWPWCTVIGVVADTRFTGFDDQPRPQIFVPWDQGPSGILTLLIRTPLDTKALTNALRQAVRGIDKDQPIDKIETVNQAIADLEGPRRFSTLLLVVFGAVALFLAALGVYGVVSYSISQRAHEIGVRMALGAKKSDVLRLVLSQAMRLAMVGVGAGLTAAFGLARSLSNLLFEVRPTDPATFAGVLLLIIGVVIVASYFPARRAANFDPMRALRCE